MRVTTRHLNKPGAVTGDPDGYQGRTNPCMVPTLEAAASILAHPIRFLRWHRFCRTAASMTDLGYRECMCIGARP